MEVPLGLEAVNLATVRGRDLRSELYKCYGPAHSAPPLMAICK